MWRKALVPWVTCGRYRAPQALEGAFQDRYRRRTWGDQWACTSVGSWTLPTGGQEAVAGVTHAEHTPHPLTPGNSPCLCGGCDTAWIYLSASPYLPRQPPQDGARLSGRNPSEENRCLPNSLPGSQGGKERKMFANPHPQSTIQTSSCQPFMCVHGQRDTHSKSECMPGLWGPVQTKDRTSNSVSLIQAAREQCPPGSHLPGLLSPVLPTYVQGCSFPASLCPLCPTIHRQPTVLHT